MQSRRDGVECVRVRKSSLTLPLATKSLSHPLALALLPLQLAAADLPAPGVARRHPVSSADQVAFKRARGAAAAPHLVRRG
jgi:hypothetical protein